MQVDGVEFEIITSRFWHVPKRNIFARFLNIFKPYYNHPKPSIPIKIGIKIVNNTDESLRFNFFSFLVPEITNIIGEVPLDGFSFHPESVMEAQLPLLKPGESTTYALDAVVFWNWCDNFGLHIIGGNGFFWYIQPLKFSTYNLSLTYSNEIEKITVTNEAQDIELQDFWVGRVSIPPVEICITSS